MNEAYAQHFRVEGRVQGVGYRAFTQRHARNLHLQGIVYNCPDGSVEGTVYGKQPQMQLFENALHTGPPHSHVMTVQFRPSSRPSNMDFIIVMYPLGDQE